MIIPALNAQNVYGSGKGEAYKLSTPDLSKQADMLVGIAEQTAKIEGSLDEKVDIDAWAPNYYHLAEEVETLKNDWAKRKATGEVNALQAGAGYQRELDKVMEKARLTKQQEGNWLKTKEIYDKDDKGLYDRTIGYTKLQVYENPEKFQDIPGYTDIKTQLESVGGDIIKWRTKFGSYYIQPELAYDDDKYSKEIYSPIKTITDSSIGRDPLVDGVVTTTTQAINIPSIIEVGRKRQQLAINGDFNATRYLQTANAYINRQLRFDADGTFNPTPEGRGLLQVVNEIYTLDTENGTIDFNDGSGPVELNEQTFRTAVLDAYNVQKGRKYQEEKTTLNVNLNRSTRNNINVSTGGGVDPRAKLPYFTTQKENYANWANTEYRAIQQEFNTPEERNSDSYLNAIYSGLQKALDIDQTDKTATNFWSAKINTKVPVQAPNRAENVNDLSIQTNDTRVPIKGITGEVTNLVPRQQTFVLGYYAPDGQWRIATNKQLKSGEVTLDQVRLSVRTEYNVTKPKDYKPKQKEQPNVKSTTAPTKRSPEDELYDATNGGANHVVRIFPFEEGVAESLDANIKGADQYRHYRGEGASNIPGKVQVDLQEDINDAFD